jgi:CheY-like chemotaxis protein
MAGEKILVVEDQRALAGALQMRLRGLGYSVMAVAKDGAEAIEKASALHPDLILMEIRLGEGMDGIEAARQIRAQLDIPAVYVSAYVDRKLLGRARQTLPAGFINKPFTTITLALFQHQDKTTQLDYDVVKRAG